MLKQLLPAAFLLVCHFLQAQIVINEVSAANLNGITDGNGEYEDWVELYNTGATAVNIGGWYLSDNPAKPQKWTIPVGQSVPAFGYKLIFCSGKDKVEGINLHSNFKLTQTKGESVVLTQSNNSLVDNYTFTIPNQLNHSYGRVPNGSATWKIYTQPSPDASNGVNAFQQYAPVVTTNPDAGFFSGSVSVSLSTDPGYTIRYTLNGSEPTNASTIYSGPINITTTTVLKARAYSANAQILPGFVTANTYFINETHTIPVVSISGDNLNNLMAGNGSIPLGCFEYFENQTVQAEGYGEFNKHGNDSWAYPQRGVDWITRDQTGYTDELKERFFPERTRKKFQRVILKAAANDNYPFSGGAHIRDAYVQTLAIRGGFDVDARTCRFCVVYVNGKYWGVYDMREKVDDADFTSYYYDQDEQDIDFIKTWGNTWLEYGSGTDWYTLKAFILGNNMAIPANFDQVKAQFDLQSLIDYIILNQHTVCKDWLNWNTAWWRGRNPSGGAQKWRYALWDEDATFGHYYNYTGIPDITALADPCDVEELGDWGDPQNHIDVLVALFANAEFKAMYINRYAELLNTSLSCAYMNALLDTMTNEIEPEMNRQCQRWGGTVAEWKQNVQKIHDFINTRCIVLDQSIVDCYDVTGPYQLQVKISPAASPNNVMVNTITPAAYPYNGDYFGDVNIPLTAVPAQGWQFDHWEVNGNNFGPDQFATAMSLAFKQSGMVTAFFTPLAPCGDPTGLVIASNNIDSTLVQWTANVGANSYHIRYRQVGDPIWTETNSTPAEWQSSQLPGCTDFELQVQSVCPASSSLYTTVYFSTPNHLAGFDLADVTFCNNDTAKLDATVSGASYQWEDGSTSPARAISTPGVYWVRVDLDACSKTDTLTVAQINAVGQLQTVICPGESLSIGGTTFDAQNPAGQAVLPGAGASGCDSIVNVSLQVLSISQYHVLATSCDPAAVGQDTLILQNAVGCDSLLITTTSLAPVSQISISVTSCDPAMAGIDTLVLTSVYGCDSLIITNTAFVPITPTFLSASSCDPAQVGVDTLVLSTVYGCDSLVITNTAFIPLSPTLLNAGSCDPAMVGVDTMVLSTLYGCDSLVITTTTLLPISQTLLNASSCNPNLAGIDTLILSNIYGCDSLIITTTSFDPAGISITQLSAATCNPAGVGKDTLVLQNFAGCDSLVITTTAFDPAGISITKLNASTCNPTLAGIDTLTLSTVQGCDSLVITNTVFDPNAISLTQLDLTTCDQGAAGRDTVYLQNLAGCDSLVITTRTYSGLSLAPATVVDFVCFGEKTGLIRLDTALSPTLPLEIELENVSSKIYTGTPLSWDQLPAGTYTLSATNAEGCSDEQQLEIEEGQPLSLALQPASITIHAGDSILLAPTIDFPLGAVQWTPGSGLSCATCLSTYLKTDQAGLYQVKVIDPNGCEVSAALQVQIEKGVRVFVPNAIRPGSGGENANLFFAAGAEVLRVRAFEIFDRWGDQVYAKYDFVPDASNTWDGTWKGQAIAPGVLVWYGEVETYDGQVLKFHGDITVIR